MSLATDIQFAFRIMMKRPGTTVITISTLALGIGLTVMTYSIVNGALRDLPFESTGSILHLERRAENRSAAVPIHDLVDWQEQQSSLEGLAGYRLGTANLSTPDSRPERYSAAFITANGFDLLGIEPHLGRSFLAGEDEPGASKTVVLGYDLWRNRFAADREALGRSILINGESWTIIGVMPDGFRFPQNQDLWLPLMVDALELPRGEGPKLEVYGPLKPGVSIDQAWAQLTTIAERLAEAHPEANEGVGIVVKPFIDEFVGDSRGLLYTMLVGVLGVLFVACINVSNLLLASAASRSKEVAIRTALGAKRRRVISQLMVEVFLQSLVGGILGFGIAILGIRYFNREIAGLDMPFWIDIRLDMPVYLFALGVIFLSSMVAGFLPAWLISRSDVNAVLKEEDQGSSGRGSRRWSKALVMAEVAFSCGLMGVTGLMVKSVVSLEDYDYGFETRQVLTANLELPTKDYPDVESRQAFCEIYLERLTARPEFDAVTLASHLPAQYPSRWRFQVEGTDSASQDDLPITRRVLISPSYFETLGVKVEQGRGFTPQDRRDGLPVAIVNRAFSQRFFGDEDPIGRQLRMGLASAENERPWRTIVGIVPDLHLPGLDNIITRIYLPLDQSETSTIAVAARSSGDPQALASPLRAELAEVDPYMPIFNVRTMADLLGERTWHYGLFAKLFTVFGSLALLLAAIGFYGVMAFTLEQRHRELGIRKALGAGKSHLFSLVIRQGIWQLVVGLIFGLLLALALSQSLQVVLFEVEPFDPIVFIMVVAAMTLTGLVAFVISLVRASRIDPATMLRYE